MATSRDELFCKLAIRQGAWTQEEAVLFLQHYRLDGQGQRFGEWAAQQGAIDANLAARIENAINQRVEGHVQENRKRIPAVGAQGSTASSGAKRSTRRSRRGGAGSGLDFNRHPVQSTIYVACGVIAMGLLFYIVFLFQKQDVPTPVPQVADSSKNGTADSGSSATTTSQAAQQVPTFSSEELKAMSNRIQMSITDARSYLRDGKTPIGLKGLMRLREELGGDGLPEELRGKIDAEIAEISTIVAEIYAELLEELMEARAAKNSEDIQDLLSEIESSCGSAFRALAEKEGS